MLTFKNIQKVLPRLYSFLPYYFGWKYAFPPAHAFFEVTYRCNLRCEMCHYLEIIEDTETNRKFKNELSAEAVCKVIAKLPRFSVITFTGGEAFMKSDFMEILKFAASRHKVHVITNGTLLTEQVVESLMEIRLKSFLGSGLFYVGVSLEGLEDQHDKITLQPGSFKKTDQGLQRLVGSRNGDRFPLVHLTCVMGKDNVSQLSSLYDYANDREVTVFNLVLNNTVDYNHVKDYDQEPDLMNPSAPVEEIDPDILREQIEKIVEKSKTHKTQLRFSPNHITPEEIVRYYSNKSSYRDYRCYIPWTKVAVSAYGDVFSCPLYRVGNINGNGGSLPWQGDRAKQFRQMLKKEKIFPGCLGCCQSEYIGKS